MEGKRKGPRRSGPSRRASHPVPGDDLVLGIDLGATKVVSALVDSGGSLWSEAARTVHANDGPDGVLRDVVATARRTMAGAQRAPVAVGVGVAAQVDPERGKVVHAPNLRWRNVPLRSRISRALALPTFVVNDARAAAYAEWQFGAARGLADAFVLSLGTGIGGSAIVGGQLCEGSTHAAGEVGHLTIVGGGRRCHCPNRGCFEAYVGGWAIAERSSEFRRTASNGGRSRPLSAAQVFHRARAGEPWAIELVEETGRFLEDGVVSVVNAFNPAVLVLVGGLVSGMPSYVTRARSAIRRRCQPPAAGAKVVKGALGELAGLRGAAALAHRGN